MRSCAPECFCTLMRNASAGTLNSAAPTLTGTRPGSFEGSDSQVGHSRYATSATAPVTITPDTATGTRWPRRGLRHRRVLFWTDEKRVMTSASWRVDSCRFLWGHHANQTRI